MLNAFQDENSFYIPSELQFDDNIILQNLFSKVFSQNSNDITKDYKIFNSLLSVHKNYIKLNKLPANDSVTLLKILFLLEIRKLNFIEAKLNSNSNSYASNNNNNVLTSPTFSSSKTITRKEFSSSQIINSVGSIKETSVNCNLDSINSANKISTSDCNELSYEVYSLLFDPNSNEIKMNILDSITHLILGEFLSLNNSIVTFEKYTNLIEGITSNSTTISGNMKALLIPKISFEIFLKYFKILIYFFFYSENYKQIFSILDSENKNKILGAELIVCFNKLIRNLEENNIFIIFTKKFMGLIDSNQIYLTKYEYYSTLTKSLSI
jgi:hypothetical protein